MLLLGIDVGTSSVKINIVHVGTKKLVASAVYPDQESSITAIKPGWAEQSPNMWWKHVQEAILICHETGRYDPYDIRLSVLPIRCTAWF
jgi:xylulokinase